VRKLLVLAAGVAVFAAGCGSSKPSQPKGYVHPIGAYVAPGCSQATENRQPQYVAVTNWTNGRITGNSGRFSVPDCANVIVYVDSDKADELRIAELGIAAKVTPGRTAMLEFYAPHGTYPVRLHRHRVELLRVVVGKD
jgi:hypothetical protein